LAEEGGARDEVELCMIRCMCGLTLKERQKVAELRFGLELVITIY